MSQTYAQLQKQIASLQAQATRLKETEVAEVVSNIKEAIAAYGLTAQDLFGSRGGKSRQSGAKDGAAAKYADGAGNTWVGRGKRPQWLVEALAAGKQLSDFEVGAVPKKSRSSASSPVNGRKKAGGKRKSAGRPKFRDEAGNSWTGHGRQPQWFRDAIASGKTPEQLQA